MRGASTAEDGATGAGTGRPSRAGRSALARLRGRWPKSHSERHLLALADRGRGAADRATRDHHRPGRTAGQVGDLIRGEQCGDPRGGHAGGEAADYVPCRRGRLGCQGPCRLLDTTAADRYAPGSPRRTRRPQVWRRSLTRAASVPCTTVAVVDQHAEQRSADERCEYLGCRHPLAEQRPDQRHRDRTRRRLDEPARSTCPATPRRADLGRTMARPRLNDTVRSPGSGLPAAKDVNCCAYDGGGVSGEQQRSGPGR